MGGGAASQGAVARSVSAWWLEVVPLLVVLSVLVLAQEEVTMMGPQASESDDGNIFRQAGLGAAYLLAGIGLLRQPGFAERLVREAWVLAPLFMLVAVSVLWAIDVRKVYVNLIHYVGLTMVVAGATREGRFRSVITWLCVWHLFVLAASVAVSLVLPDIGQSASELHGVRWRGLTSHPNSLGSVAVTGIWTGLVLLLCKEIGGRWWAALLVLALAGVAVIGADSVTSLIVGIWLAMGAALLQWVMRGKGAAYWVRLVALGGVGLAVLAGVALLDPGVFTPGSAAGAVGRDETLTGRTGIWVLGMRWFAERPWLGWGYDSLVTLDVISGHRIPTQFHNGYVHLLVMGGIAGVFMLLAITIAGVIGMAKLRRREPAMYVSLMLLLSGILLHNVTEASLLREASYMWVFFVLWFFWARAGVRREVAIRKR